MPDPETVFRQVARVLRPGGPYRVGFHNPFTFEASETDWDGRGYPLRRPYRDGEVTWDDPDWAIEREDGSTVRVVGPREFCHTMGTMINGLARAGFAVTGIEDGAMDDVEEDPNAPPGSWEHYLAVMRPFLGLWAANQS